MKTCTKCKIPKEEKDFYKDSRRPNGLKSWCKTCHSADSKNRESRYNEYRRRYRLEHKDEAQLSKKQYYQENKTEILKTNAEWRQTLNGRLLSYKRSAKQRDIPWFLTKDEFASFWKKPCYYCGDLISTIGLDRIDSSKGYTLQNIVPCCSQCNTIKLDYSQEEFITKIKKIWEHTQRSREIS